MNNRQTTAAGVRAALARIPHTHQYEVAQALGVSAVTVRNWKLGLHEPSPKYLLRIADVAGVDVEWIRNGGVDE